VAERFKSKVRLAKEAMWVNGKSILAILSLAAEQGCELLLEVEGSDEQEAFAALKTKLENCDS
jgi:phosphocarrier protein